MSQKNNIKIGEIDGNGNSVAARDVYNTTTHQNFTGCSSADKMDDRVMNEIFDHIEKLELANSAHNSNSSEENNNKILLLKEKISLNFNEESQQEFSTCMAEIWDTKGFVEDFVKIKLETEETKILAIKHKIQKLYRDIKDSSTETKIENIRVIDNMVTKCIPPSKNGDSIYELYTKAVICYFFEFCDFGKKTKVEEKNRKTL